MALPRRSAGGHHILLWGIAAVAILAALVLAIVVTRGLMRSWFP